jgi:murein L,D-transpeptidase YcbB/YkuD
MPTQASGHWVDTSIPNPSMRRQFSRRQIQLSAGFAVAVAATAIPSARSWLHSSAPTAAAADEGVRLAADLSERRITVYNNSGEVTTYGVAVGSPKYPTPPGTYTIRKIVWNPAWVPPDRDWAKKKEPQPPGAKKNPMRVVKIYFKEPDYYIHGTDDPESIGDAASHGCLRMEPSQAADLARYLMDHGGAPRSESWFSRVLHFRSETQTVYLDNPVRFTISE